MFGGRVRRGCIVSCYICITFLNMLHWIFLSLNVENVGECYKMQSLSQYREESYAKIICYFSYHNSKITRGSMGYTISQDH